MGVRLEVSAVVLLGLLVSGGSGLLPHRAGPDGAFAAGAFPGGVVLTLDLTDANS